MHPHSNEVTELVDPFRDAEAVDSRVNGPAPAGEHRWEADAVRGHDGVAARPLQPRLGSHAEGGQRAANEKRWADEEAERQAEARRAYQASLRR